MFRIEEIIKMIYRFYRKQRKHSSSVCPDEEVLACFAEGNLSRKEARKIQDHLISCCDCAELVSLFFKEIEQAEEVPEALVSKAKGLLNDKVLHSLFDISLRLKEKALEILHTTGDVILNNEIIPLPVLRSRQIRELPDEITFIKELNDVKITLCLQKRDRKEVRINLRLTDRATSNPLSDLRLIIFKDDSEVESYDAPQGSAVFDRIGFGHYSVQILRQGGELGVIKLEIQ
ncbi:MAG: hypothetical protein KJ838_05130 [Candidatus Omnitrophica bacterium]|nr:hypothetical protein [Candidatus Omnitrophota bacterium]